MNKTISIKNNIEFVPEIEEFLNPDYVYYPYNRGDKLLAKVGDNLYKEQPLLEQNGEIIYSSISGTLIGTTGSMLLKNEEVNCLVIENNYKETVKNKKGAVKYINEYTKRTLLSTLRKFSSFEKLINIDSKILIINGIDKDPYEKTYSSIINNNCTKILETIDAISSILEIENAIFVANNHDNNNVINLTNHIGTYPNIRLKLLTDLYPNGFKELVVNNVLTKKQQNDGYMYFTVEDIYNIYTILKRVKPVTEKLITISGNCIEKSKVVSVKIGSNISEIINNCCEFIEEEYNVVTNGLIAGDSLTNINQILTNDIRSIFLNTIDSEKSRKCINCGLCNSKCPVNLNPKYLLEHKKADHSKCINCGLCTYICPAKINFKPHLGGKNE
ncbi:MAG: 4Fe-4S binding protein [Erysipelotrichales bacterium]|nr:4Fe-4S binding protein [Erysipelotrichales bacterium]